MTKNPIMSYACFSQPSFVLAEVGFNFLGSHVEMDLITAGSVRRISHIFRSYPAFPGCARHFPNVRFSLALLRCSVSLSSMLQEHTIATGELDLVHSADHPINARQWIATHLDP